LGAQHVGSPVALGDREGADLLAGRPALDGLEDLLHARNLPAVTSPGGAAPRILGVPGRVTARPPGDPGSGPDRVARPPRLTGPTDRYGERRWSWMTPRSCRNECRDGHPRARPPAPTPATATGPGGPGAPAGWRTTRRSTASAAWRSPRSCSSTGASRGRRAATWVSPRSSRSPASSSPRCW